MAELFGPGQPLDAARYFVILPDSIGHGASSKPSDGLHARFPRYDYADMVRAQYRLVTEALGVERLQARRRRLDGRDARLAVGGDLPRRMDAIVPMVCLPVEVSGRNRMLRRLITDAVRGDPAWKGGEYTTPPPGLRAALQLVMISGRKRTRAVAARAHRAAADKFLDDFARQRLPQTDANDFLYAWESSSRLRPLRAAAADPRTRPGHQLRGRRAQPARAGDHGARDRARGARSLRADTCKRQHRAVTGASTKCRCGSRT